MRSEVRVLPDPPFIASEVVADELMGMSPLRSAAPTQPQKWMRMVGEDEIKQDVEWEAHTLDTGRR